MIIKKISYLISQSVRKLCWIKYIYQSILLWAALKECDCIYVYNDKKSIFKITTIKFKSHIEKNNFTPCKGVSDAT